MSSTRVADIDVLNQDYLDKRLFIQEVKIDQEEIIIKGAEHSVNKVATVKALVDIKSIVNENGEPKIALGKKEKIVSTLKAYDENGNDVGYDCVHEDQIEWYKATSKAAIITKMMFCFIILFFLFFQIVRDCFSVNFNINLSSLKLLMT